MAFADTVGAVARCPTCAGAGTTTLESKTNFFRGANGVVRAETPLHRGNGPWSGKPR